MTIQQTKTDYKVVTFKSVKSISLILLTCSPDEELATPVLNKDKKKYQKASKIHKKEILKYISIF